MSGERSRPSAASGIPDEDAEVHSTILLGVHGFLSHRRMSGAPAAVRQRMRCVLISLRHKSF